MMRRLLCLGILLWAFQHFACAQLYRNITTAHGLTNNYVYSIAQDKKGYTWFLSSSGIDRFDGQDFIHFPVDILYRPIGVSSNFQIISDHEGGVWEVGTYKGNCICRFDEESGKFVYIPINGVNNNGLRFLFLDRHNRIWLSNKNRIIIYDIKTSEQTEIAHPVDADVLCGAEVASNDYVIGTDVGIMLVRYRAGQWEVRQLEGEIVWKNTHPTHISERISCKFVPTCLHDISTRKIVAVPTDTSTVLAFDSKSHFYRISLKTGQTDAYVIQQIHDTHITDVKPYFDELSRWFVATEGRGVFVLDGDKCNVTQYASFDYDNTPGLRGNVTLSVLAEEGDKRVWFANYPYGVCCNTIGFPTYTRHAATNDPKCSVAPGVVTEMMEDTEGDIWYATSSGISCHNRKADTWKHYLRDVKKENLTYLAVCEIRPGLIMASGLMSGGFVIDKRTDKVISINPQYFNSDSDADYNVRDIYRDDNGVIWLAGNDYLGRIDWDKKSYEAYSLTTPAMLLARMDKDHFWLVTVEEVYLVNVHTGTRTVFNLPEKCADINDMLTSASGDIYVATADEGLFMGSKDMSGRNYTFKQFTRDNSALQTNNIVAIAEESAGNIVLCTDGGLTKFYPYASAFVNWTYQQGMISTGFYKKSVLHTSDSVVYFGTYDGVIAIHDSIRLPRAEKVKTIFSNLSINNQPRNAALDFTHLNLGSAERQIAFKVGTLNYDNPNMFMYSWKLEGDNMVSGSTITKERNLRFLLKSGEYTLTVCTYNAATFKLVEERSVYISISPPWWRSATSIGAYFVVVVLIILLWHVFIYYRNKRVLAESKVNFFIRAAHEIRTPLSLIKAPLEDIAENEKLTERGEQNIHTVLRSANDLLIMTGDLLNLERMKMKFTDLKLFKTDLVTYVQDVLNPFQLSAVAKGLTLKLVSTESVEVWLDRSRMDCILQNLVSNALKYTLPGGHIDVIIEINDKKWKIIVSDDGIGIPEKDRKKITEMFYRSSNADKTAEGSGVGLFLANKLSKEHRGELNLEMNDNNGAVFSVTFPLAEEAYEGAVKISSEVPRGKHEDNAHSLLVVEDNAELRRFLKRSLSEYFVVHTAETGDEAYSKIRFIQPDIVISDIMMPGMQGDELCRKIKEDVETSHIPVILLTALVDHDKLLEGLAAMPDAYVTKPFSIDVLKAHIDTIIANRKLLQKIYSQVPSDLSLTDGGVAADAVPTEEGEGELQTNALDMEFLKLVNSMIDEHLSDSGFTVDVLCKMVGMSRTSFYNKIKTLTAYAPADFIRLHRINKAKAMLAKSHLTINEISDRCGFGDVKYFRDVFKRNVGISPTDYRNKSHTGA